MSQHNPRLMSKLQQWRKEKVGRGEPAPSPAQLNKICVANGIPAEMAGEAVIASSRAEIEEIIARVLNTENAPNIVSVQETSGGFAANDSVVGQELVTDSKPHESGHSQSSLGSASNLFGQVAGSMKSFIKASEEALREGTQSFIQDVRELAASGSYEPAHRDGAVGTVQPEMQQPVPAVESAPVAQPAPVASAPVIEQAPAAQPEPIVAQPESIVAQPESVVAQPVPAEPVAAQPVSQPAPVAEQVPIAQPEPIQPEPVQPESATGTQAEMSHEMPLTGYVAYDYEPQYAPAGRLRIELNKDGNGLQVSWTKNSEPGIYRLVASDGQKIYTPDSNVRQVAATSDNKIYDPYMPMKALRYYDVWFHAGATYDIARDVQPILWARQEYVAEVRNILFGENSGQITASWELLEPAREAKVTCEMVPLGAFKQNQGVQIPNSGGGFAQEGVETGKTYHYRVTTVVIDDEGKQFESDGVEFSVDVQHKLEPVTDMRLEVVDNSWELVWTAPPGGDVYIYENPTGVLASADNDEQDQASERLQGEWFKERRLKYAVEPHPLNPKLQRMRNVKHREDWANIYYTPVTIAKNPMNNLEERMRIGDSVVHKTRGKMGNIELHQRVFRQLITFEWPKNATSVQAKIGENYESSSALVNLVKSSYDRDGGFSFKADNKGLDSTGCTIFLEPNFPQSDTGEVPERHEIQYYGITTINYQIQPLADGFEVILTSSRRLQQAEFPPFVLVYSRKGIPLDPSGNDENGQSYEKMMLTSHGMDSSIGAFRPQELYPEISPTGRWYVSREELDRVGHSPGEGYMRLFFSVPNQNLAIIDPPIDQMQTMFMLRGVQPGMQPGAYGAHFNA